MIYYKTTRTAAMRPSGAWIPDSMIMPPAARTAGTCPRAARTAGTCPWRAHVAWHVAWDQASAGRRRQSCALGGPTSHGIAFGHVLPVRGDEAIEEWGGAPPTTQQACSTRLPVARSAPYCICRWPARSHDRCMRPDGPQRGRNRTGTGYVLGPRRSLPEGMRRFTGRPRLYHPAPRQQASEHQECRSSCPACSCCDRPRARSGDR
jgi:hypothetical protein